MARKKKNRGPGEPVDSSSADDSAVENTSGQEAVSAPNISVPDAPAIPDAPPPPPPLSAPIPPPPPRTSAFRHHDIPAIGGTEESGKPKSGKGVLEGILERSREEVNNEAAALMGAVRVQQDAQKLAREEEERRRAAEARARVEEERRKREAALKEYEARQREKEEAARPKVEAAPVAQAAQVQKKSGHGWIIAVVVAVLAVGGAVAWFAVPRGEPVTFNAGTSIERARSGMILTAPVAWGPQTLRPARTVDVATLVAAVKPAVYEAPAPVVEVQRPKKGNGKKGPSLEIRDVFGGKGVIR